MTRRIDQGFIVPAEEARARGALAEAINLASLGLGLDKEPLTTQEVNDIAQPGSPEADRLVRLARTLVDARKTSSNKSLRPTMAFGHLEQTLPVLEPVHFNRVLQTNLAGVRRDNDRNEYFVVPELFRDIGMCRDAAASLLQGEDRDQMRKQAADAYFAAYRSVPHGENFKDFVNLEYLLAEARRGQERPAPEKILGLFDKVITHYWSTNYHRLATVSAWLSYYPNGMVSREGRSLYKQIERAHPDLPNIATAQRNKWIVARLRWYMPDAIPAKVDAPRREHVMSVLGQPVFATL